MAIYQILVPQSSQPPEHVNKESPQVCVVLSLQPGEGFLNLKSSIENLSSLETLTNLSKILKRFGKDLNLNRLGSPF